MTELRVSIDADLCEGYGLCAAHAPAVFDLVDEFGPSEVIDPKPPGELHDDVRRAARYCPKSAVVVEESRT